MGPPGFEPGTTPASGEYPTARRRALEVKYKVGVYICVSGVLVDGTKCFSGKKKTSGVFGSCR